MEIRESKQDGVMVLGLIGRLDAESAQPLQIRFQKLMEAGESRFVIESGGLSYVSSSGMRLLLETARRLEPGGRIVLCAVQEPVLRVFEIAGLTWLLGICDSFQEAVQRCQAGR